MEFGDAPIAMETTEVVGSSCYPLPVNGGSSLVELLTNGNGGGDSGFSSSVEDSDLSAPVSPAVQQNQQTVTIDQATLIQLLLSSQNNNNNNDNSNNNNNDNNNNNNSYNNNNDFIQNILNNTSQQENKPDVPLPTTATTLSPNLPAPDSPAEGAGTKGGRRFAPYKGKPRTEAQKERKKAHNRKSATKYR